MRDRTCHRAVRIFGRDFLQTGNVFRNGEYRDNLNPPHTTPTAFPVRIASSLEFVLCTRNEVTHACGEVALSAAYQLGERILRIALQVRAQLGRRERAAYFHAGGPLS